MSSGRPQEQAAAHTELGVFTSGRWANDVRRLASIRPPVGDRQSV
jgi:hypothetical protein